MKKICIFTSSRAEFGILHKLIIHLKKNFDVYLIVSGTHLLRSFGKTVNEINSSKIKINKVIKYQIKKNDSQELLINISFLIKKLSKNFKKKKLDLVIILGDRYELLAPTIVATFHRIPICHIHGGEKTLTAIDDNIRHSISKMSSLHFVATSTYKKRLIQMGEQPASVHNIGSLMLDNLRKKKFLSKKNIEKKLKTNLESKNFLVTIHPETHLTDKQNLKNLKTLLESIKYFSDYKFIFTSSNSDILGAKYNSMIKNFCKKNQKKRFFKNSLGSDLYLSLAKISDGVIGNSSSGIIEVPSLGVRTINLGKRQFGRDSSKSVININFNRYKIIDNIKKIVKLKKTFKFKNPYYKPNSVNNAVKILSKFNYKKSLIKKFYDIK